MHVRKWALATALAAVMATGLSAAGPAAATTYQTTIDLDNPLLTEQFDKVVHTWSTGVAAGTVMAADLASWKIDLFSGATLLYTDVVVASGVLQPWGTSPRNPADPVFAFDLGVVTLTLFENQFATPFDFGLAPQYGISSFGPSGVQIVRHEVAGQLFESTTSTQSTAIVAVPEAAAAALFGFGLAGLGLAAYRRRTN